MSNNTSKEDREKRTAGTEDEFSQYYPDGDFENMADDDEKYQALLKKKQIILQKV